MPLKLARRKGSQVWYITGTVAGQRVREATGTADKRLAEEARGIREAELLRAAIYGKPALKLTWDDACLSYVEVTAPSVGTRALLTRLTDHFGRMRLTDIKQAEIDRAAATLCRPDAAPATRLRNVIVPTRAVLMHAARRGWCDPPMIEKVVGAAGGRRTRWLTPPEYSALRDAAAPHLRPLVVFLACTGARLGSALALDWVDVDLQHGRALLRDTKNGNDHTVELPPAAVASLAGLVYPTLDDRGHPIRDAAGRRIMAASRAGRVFRTDDGSAYPDSEGGGGQIRTAWASACRKAGFAGAWKGEKPARWWTPTDVTPHVLRHTWASWRYAFHRDILRLKAEGDWSSVALCERYAKLVPEGMLPGVLAAWGLPPTGTQLTQQDRGAA